MHNVTLGSEEGKHHLGKEANMGSPSKTQGEVKENLSQGDWEKGVGWGVSEREEVGETVHLETASLGKEESGSQVLSDWFPGHSVGMHQSLEGP